MSNEITRTEKLAALTAPPLLVLEGFAMIISFTIGVMYTSYAILQTGLVNQHGATGLALLLLATYFLINVEHRDYYASTDGAEWR